jgi:hypothetical protein
MSFCAAIQETSNPIQSLDGHLPDIVCTDLPFSVAIYGHVCGLGKVKHREIPNGDRGDERNRVHYLSPLGFQAFRRAQREWVITLRFYGLA